MCGCLLRVPYQWPGPQPRHVLWLEIKPAALWFSGRHSTYWATPVRTEIINFTNIFYKSLKANNVIVILEESGIYKLDLGTSGGNLKTEARYNLMHETQHFYGMFPIKWTIPGRRDQSQKENLKGIFINPHV